MLDGTGLAYVIYSNIKANPTIENVQTGVTALKASGADYIVAVEVTINYVITDPERNCKMICVDPHDIPVVAFVDPDMMSTMPKSLTMATGMAALIHTIEGYIIGGAWELSDMPHGVANAIILLTVMAYNAEAGEKYREISRAMGVAGVDAMSQEEYRKTATDAVRYMEVEVYVEHMLFEKFVQDLELRPVISPVQTVLDLLGHAGRGEEAADAVIAKVYGECCYTERI